MKLPWFPLTALLAAIWLPLFTVQTSKPSQPPVDVLTSKSSCGGSLNLIVIEVVPEAEVKSTDEWSNPVALAVKPAGLGAHPWTLTWTDSISGPLPRLSSLWPARDRTADLAAMIGIVAKRVALTFAAAPDELTIPLPVETADSAPLCVAQPTALRASSSDSPAVIPTRPVRTSASLSPPRQYSNAWPRRERAFRGRIRRY
jgi:hypothetical protein